MKMRIMKDNIWRRERKIFGEGKIFCLMRRGGKENEKE